MIELKYNKKVPSYYFIYMCVWGGGVRAQIGIIGLGPYSGT